MRCSLFADGARPWCALLRVLYLKVSTMDFQPAATDTASPAEIAVEVVYAITMALLQCTVPLNI